MAYLSVHKNGQECISEFAPHRQSEWWFDHDYNDTMIFPPIPLPAGSIRKLIGRDITWEDEPVEI